MDQDQAVSAAVSAAFPGNILISKDAWQEDYAQESQCYFRGAMADTVFSIVGRNAKEWCVRVVPDDVDTGGIMNARYVTCNDRQAAAILYLIACDQSCEEDQEIIKKMYELAEPVMSVLTGGNLHTDLPYRIIP